MDFKSSQFIDFIKVSTDVDKLGELEVLRKIPKMYCLVIETWHRLVDDYSIHMKNYERLLGERHRFYLEKNNIEIKSRPDRELYIFSEEEISEKKRELSKMKSDIEFVEQCKNYLKELKSSIEISLEYKKFLAGK